jgi:hypothetical protein
MTYLEKRHTKRYELTNPVKFWWVDQSGAIQASQGKTLDISSSGVMVMASKCPPKGARIQATISVAPHDGSDSPLELNVEGIVVRIELAKGTRPSQRSIGFAASVHFYFELSNDSDDLKQDASETRNTLTAGRVDESSGRAEMFRRSRGSEL